MKDFTAYMLYASLLLGSCGSSASHQSIKEEKPKDEEQQPQSGSQQTKLNTDAVLFVKHTTTDNEGTGLAAFTCLIPEGWNMNDRIYWEYRDPTVPIRYKGKIQSKDGKMAMEVFPDSRHVWYTGPAGANGQRPPRDIVEGLKFLVKTERPEKNLRYVDQKIIATHPQTSYQNGAQVRSSSQTGMVKVAYEEAGETVEEEFYGQLDISDVAMPTAYGNSEEMIWSGNSLYSVKAPQGKLAQCRQVAQTVRYSSQLTKPFFNRLLQVIQLLSDQAYQRIYQAGQISRIISATNDQMIANIDATYQQAQKANEQINNNFSDYMRGVDRYTDGGSEVQLPSGYANAWVNDRGQYLVSNTGGYDPSHDFEGTWRQLDKK